MACRLAGDSVSTRRQFASDDFIGVLPDLDGGLKRAGQDALREVEVGVEYTNFDPKESIFSKSLPVGESQATWTTETLVVYILSDVLVIPRDEKNGNAIGIFGINGKVDVDLNSLSSSGTERG